MTPELKTACEVVFQEHKISGLPVKWNRDSFRGKISIGLSEIAKETLVRKNIILLPHRSKKIITHLNPAVAAAASFEEAETMIENKIPDLTAGITDEPVHITHQVSGSVTPRPAFSYPLLSIAGKSGSRIAGVKWYMKPLFYYFVWPVCVAAAGALITYLIGIAYSALFLNPK